MGAFKRDVSLACHRYIRVLGMFLDRFAFVLFLFDADISFVIRRWDVLIL